MSHERKKLLDEMADAFIISPGGIGTYDELFEMLTLKNLGQHKKVMAVLNTNGYYDSLLAVLESGIKAGVENFVVELDVCPGHPLDSLKISADYLRANFM